MEKNETLFLLLLDFPFPLSWQNHEAPWPHFLLRDEYIISPGLRPSHSISGPTIWMSIALGRQVFSLAELISLC